MKAGWCSLEPPAAGIHRLWTSVSVSESNGCLPVPRVSLGTWPTVMLSTQSWGCLPETICFLAAPEPVLGGGSGGGGDESTYLRAPL